MTVPFTINGIGIACDDPDMLLRMAHGVLICAGTHLDDGEGSGAPPLAIASAIDAAAELVAIAARSYAEDK